MKALVQTTPGDLQGLQIKDITVPTPAEEQIRVKIHYCGLNPVDAKLLVAQEGQEPEDYVPGLDFAGVVDEVGPGVHRVRVGDRVAGHGAIGLATGLAEYTLADPQTVAIIPDQVSFSVAAALPCAGLTALQSLERMQVDNDDTVLIMAAGGAVGSFAVQLGALRGAQVIATASGSDQERVRKLGARHVVDHHQQNVFDEIIKITENRGVDAIVDSLPAPSASNGLKMLAFNGQIACIGGRPDLETLAAFSTAPSVHEIALGAAHASGDLKARTWLGTGLAQLLEMVRNGQLDPLVSSEVELAEAGAALQLVLDGKAHGKIVVKI